jgi:hypothetical protein
MVDLYRVTDLDGERFAIDQLVSRPKIESTQVLTGHKHHTAEKTRPFNFHRRCRPFIPIAPKFLCPNKRLARRG